MDSGGELHVQALLNRLEEIHHEVMRDVEAAEREHILVFRPLAFHQFDIESLLLEETILDRAENRRLACDADVSDTDFRGTPCRGEDLASGLLQPAVKSMTLSATVVENLRRDMV